MFQEAENEERGTKGEDFFVGVSGEDEIEGVGGEDSKIVGDELEVVELSILISDADQPFAESENGFDHFGDVCGGVGFGDSNFLYFLPQPKGQLIHGFEFC